MRLREYFKPLPQPDRSQERLAERSRPQSGLPEKASLLHGCAVKKLTSLAAVGRFLSTYRLQANKYHTAICCGNHRPEPFGVSGHAPSPPEKPEDSSSPSLTVGQHCSTVAAMGVLGPNPSPTTRKGHVMNRKTYGAHCSGWQHSPDERRHRHENTKTITCLTLAATGFLILSLQPYAGPWSILAGFMCCSPVMLSFALSKGTQK